MTEQEMLTLYRGLDDWLRDRVHCALLALHEEQREKNAGTATFDGTCACHIAFELSWRYGPKLEWEDFDPRPDFLPVPGAVRGDVAGTRV